MLRDRLHEETKLYHEEVKSRLPIARLDFNLTHYQHLILSWHQVLEVLEPFIWSFEEWRTLQVCPVERRKLSWVQQDLKYFNLPSPASSSWKPRWSWQNFSEALGCAYVLESSSLGGPLIARHLQDRWGLDGRSGARFYEGYGARTGVAWQGFAKALDTWEKGRSARECDRVIAAAVQALQSLQGWLH